MRVGEGEDRRADTERPPPKKHLRIHCNAEKHWKRNQNTTAENQDGKKPTRKWMKTKKVLVSKNPLISFRRSSCRDDLFGGVIFLKPLRPNIDEAPEH